MTLYNRLVPLSVRNRVRINLLNYYPFEIHIENITETSDRLIGWLKKHPKTMFMLGFSENKPSDEVLEKYNWLLTKFYTVNPFGLHVHFNSYSTQQSTINEALQYFHRVGFSTVDFASGHWKYNYETFEVCKKLGLVRVHVKTSEIEKLCCGVPCGISILPVGSHLHDYDL